MRPRLMSPPGSVGFLRRRRVAGFLRRGLALAVGRAGAHHAVGAIVGAAMQAGIPLSQLPIETMREHAADIDESIYESLGTDHAVEAFVSYGSTAPDQVRHQIDRWKKTLQ